MSGETIAVACDHAGVTLKMQLVDILKQWGKQVLDLGTNDEASVDYPDFANKVATALSSNQARFGIVICGSGVGISIAANRHRHIRAALCSEPVSARLARQHNDANVLALGARIIGTEMAKECMHAFLNTEFEGGRHTRRVEKLSNPEG